MPPKARRSITVGEIYLAATPATDSQVLDNANKILDQLRNGASFAGYARQYSEAPPPLSAGTWAGFAPSSFRKSSLRHSAKCNRA